MDPARLPDGIPESFLLELFVRSGTESMERFREAIVRWTDLGSEAGLADARRLAHNLKGSSYQLGLEELAHLADAIELFTVELLRNAADTSAAPLLRDAAELALSALRSIGGEAPFPDLTPMTARLREFRP